jgi:hypothetical protein
MTIPFIRTAMHIRMTTIMVMITAMPTKVTLMIMVSGPATMSV